ncbi:hypothetical protein MMPV_002612 [Pyropia vietnamensis]
MAHDHAACGGVADGAPEYVAHRIAVWDAAVARAEAAQKEAAAAAGADGAAPPRSISVTLPDGSVKAAVAGTTRPLDIAMGISEGLARASLVAVVDDVQWDMERPLEADCALRLCDWSTEEGKMVLWHSTAHMLGEAMEYKYGGELCIGPPLKAGGFYYDMHMGGGRPVTDVDFGDLEKRVDKIAKSKRTFQRLELSKEEARDMFSYNRFKLELVNKMEEGTTITAYRDGPFIDLCRGPHVPSSSKVKAVAVLRTGSAYWLGNADNPSLQRVYGISFPDKKLLKEYRLMLAEAAKRDHRLIGKNQELFLFHGLSPGSAFLLPHGTRLFNTLLEFMRNEYWERGYDEVQTPNLFDFDLWETSGHAANYRDAMFSLESEHTTFGLKPMNCPSHCLIYASRSRSYRELPMRLADFGVLHRNELSGALSGLTRVRRFQQDDAHIFCAANSVADEVTAFLGFLQYVYDIFGFSFTLALSTRPDKYIGSVAQWEAAEAELEAALVRFTGKARGEAGGWGIKDKDGAFYGPKVDVCVTDAMGREWQLGTCQLDFNAPLRFDLWYRGPNTKEPEEAEGSAAAGSTKQQVKAAKAAKAAAAAKAVDDAAAASDAPLVADAVPPTPEEAAAAKAAAAAAEAERKAAHDAHLVAQGFRRPVIIHRAIYGSLERFIAIICEHYGGKFPFWLSPRQAIVVPVSERFLDYAHTVAATLRRGRFYVDVDTSDQKLSKKIVLAELAQYNHILVVGAEEVEKCTVNLRSRGSTEHRVMTVEEVHAEFRETRAAHK